MSVKVSLFEESLGGIDIVHTVHLTDDQKQKLTTIPPGTSVDATISCKDIEPTSPTFDLTTTFVKHIGETGSAVINPQDISSSSRYLLEVASVQDNSTTPFSSCTANSTTCCGCLIEGCCCGNCTFTPTYDANGACTNTKSSCSLGCGCIIHGCKIPQEVKKNRDLANKAIQDAAEALAKAILALASI